MIERREGHFSGSKQDELFFQSWARPGARATIVLTHGIGEHSECYNKTAEALVPLGWNIFAWDLRGHGRSSGKRGYVEDFRDYDRDLDCLIQFLQNSKRLSGPFAVLGHSLGGLITLRYALEAGKSLPADCILLSSPLLGISMPVPPLKEMAAHILRRLWPKITLGSEINYENLTRDPALLKSYPLDPLRHDKISPPLYFGMLENIAYARAHVSELRKPILVQAAGHDKVVDVEATKAAFAEIGSVKKQLLIYPDSRHEIFNDLDREGVFADLNQFLNEVFDSASGSNYGSASTARNK